jgi:photosystem II stability/assembly factor-like uncharacterized protein
VRHAGTEQSAALWGAGLGQYPGHTISVVVGEQGRILTSADGRTWLPRNSGTTEWLTAVANSGSNFWIAVGDHGTILRSADDGQTWTRAARPGTTARLNGINYQYASGGGGPRWIAVGESGTIIVSADGDTWSTVSSGTTAWLRGITKVNDLTVIVGQRGIALYSTDAPEWRNWRVASTGVTADLEAVALDTRSGRLVAVGESGAVLISSGTFDSPPTGWTLNRNVPPDVGRLRSVSNTWAGLMAVGERGTIQVAPNGLGTWSSAPASAPLNLNAVVGTPRGQFVIGANETIADVELPFPNRVANLSTRAFVGPAEETSLFSGFVVGGAGKKRVLIRAVGPTLATFGINAPLRRPLLRLFDAGRRLIARNERWSAEDSAAIRSANVTVGAFPLPDDSLDTALLVTLDPGSYSAMVSSVDGGTGIALIEAYELDELATEGSRLVNISSRGLVGSGQALMVPGIVISGSGSRLLLMRAVGPGLNSFGVSGTLPDPWMRVVDASGAAISFNDNWNTPWTNFSPDEIRDVSVRAGAFALQDGSKDAVVLFRAPAGNYSVFVANMGDETQSGVVLVEVYDVTER